MIRESSIEVYNQIKEEGLLSKLRFATYETVFKHGPLTMAEAASIMKNGSKSVSPRFAELKKAGVIKEVGKKICGISGRNVIAWDATKKLPIKLEKEKRIKCKHCDGKGYIKTQQARLF